MKKRGLLRTSLLFLILFLTGCSDKGSAEEYLGEQITTVKEKDFEKLSFLLEEGIEKSNEQYVLQFPTELKEPYLLFLQEAFRTVEFEAADAKKNGDSQYTVRLSYRPLDIAASTQIVTNQFLDSLDSSDLQAAVSALLESSKSALKENSHYSEKTYTTLSIDKTDDGFRITDSEFKALLSQTLKEYMSPYNSVCELLNAQDLLKSYLDASFKGDAVQFAKHTGKTEREALAWYNDGSFAPSSDMAPAYEEQYTDALKALLKQCVYTVGIPKKETGIYNYTVNVEVTPNNSLLKVLDDWRKGAYYSEEEVDKALIELIKKYAETPSYGEKTAVTVSLNLNSIAEAGNEGAELTELARTILPIP